MSETGPRGRNPDFPLKATLAVAACVIVVVEAVVLVRAVTSGPPDRPREDRVETRLTVPPLALPTVGSLVSSEVRPNGSIVVSEWLRGKIPIRSIVLSAYDTELPTEAPTATDGRIVTAHGTVARDLVIGPEPQTVTLRPPARLVRISYVLHGVVDRSSSVTGRALSGVTSLDVDYPGESGPRTVSIIGSRVLNLACNDVGADVTEREPCGTPDALGRRVTLTGADREDHVTAQVDLR